MSEKKYSVIIPAYNAEKTIARCLDSILAYARDDVEILLVNDGSKDETDSLCRDYAAKWPQIRYFSKPNGGVSSARNMGLDRASGKYLLFVDSDDYLCGDVFALSDVHMPENEGILLFGTESFDGREKRPHAMKQVKADDCESAAAVLSGMLAAQSLNAPSAKLFCRSIIEANKIRFDERLAIGEDKVFVVQYLMHVCSMAACSEIIYGLSVENAESLSRKKRENLADSILLEHELLFSVAEGAPLPDKCKDLYRRAIGYSYHRSAYTVVSELRKFAYSKPERIKRTRAILARYAERKHFKYYDLQHFLFSLPVRFRMARLVDRVLSVNETR